MSLYFLHSKVTTTDTMNSKPINGEEKILEELQPVLDSFKSFAKELKAGNGFGSAFALFVMLQETTCNFVRRLVNKEIMRLDKAMREKVSGVLEDYLSLLDNTTSTAAKILVDASLNASALDTIQKAAAYVREGKMEHARAVLKREPLVVPNESSLDPLLKEYADLLARVSSARTEMEALAKRYKVLKWIFVGVMVGSGVVLVASGVVLTVFTCGVAAPVVVAAEAAVAVPLAAIIGVTVGAVGLGFSGALLSASVLGYHFFSQLEQTAEETKQLVTELQGAQIEMRLNIKELLNKIIAAKTAVRHQSLLVQGDVEDVEWEVVFDSLRDPELLGQVQISKEHSVALQKQAGEVFKRATEQRRDFEEQNAAFQLALKGSLEHSNLADWFVWRKKAK